MDYPSEEKSKSKDLTVGMANKGFDEQNELLSFFTSLLPSFLPFQIWQYDKK